MKNVLPPRHIYIGKQGGGQFGTYEIYVFEKLKYGTSVGIKNPSQWQPYKIVGNKCIQ